MILKEWLLRSGISQKKMAKDLGMAHVSLCLLANGRRNASLKVACIISDYTKGAVSRDEVLFPLKHTSIIPLKGDPKKCTDFQLPT